MKEDWKTWLIGALFAIAVLFGTTYMDNIAAQQRDATQTLLAHSERITTLEESKRNTETLLQGIKVDLEEIKRALRTQ